MLADDESILDDKRFISKFARRDHLANCRSNSRILQLSSDMHETLAQLCNRTKVGCHHDIIVFHGSQGLSMAEERSHFLSMALGSSSSSLEQEYSSTRWYIEVLVVSGVGHITTTFSVETVTDVD
jgi:hypothetical protein